MTVIRQQDFIDSIEDDNDADANEELFLEDGSNSPTKVQPYNLIGHRNF